MSLLDGALVTGESVKGALVDLIVGSLVTGEFVKGALVDEKIL